MTRTTELIERAAEAIYEAMPHDGKGGPKKPAWVPLGNSDKQEEARLYAVIAIGEARDALSRSLNVK